MGLPLRTENISFGSTTNPLSLTTSSTENRGGTPVMPGTTAPRNTELGSIGLSNSTRGAGNGMSYNPYLAAASTNQFNAMQQKKQNEEIMNQTMEYWRQGQAEAEAALNRAREADISKIRALYDDSARNYYRLYRSQERDLPEQLSSIGATGGATESAALRLMNGYSDNLYKNENSRNGAIYDAESGYNNQIAQNSINYANMIANAYSQLAQQQLAADTAARQYQQELFAGIRADKQAKAEAEAAAAAQTALVNRNNKVHANENARLRQGYTTTHWTDDDGAYHYQISGKKEEKKKSGSGSGSSSKKDNNKPPKTSSGSGKKSGSSSNTNSSLTNGTALYLGSLSGTMGGTIAGKR